MKADDVVTGPMTRAQKFQWFLEKGLAEGLRPLPASANESSTQELVTTLEERFEIFRTSLDTVGGELRQKVHRRGSQLRVVDIPPGSDAEQQMAELVSDFKAHRHGRTGEFLVEFTLIRGAGENWLGVVADNVAMDAGFHGVVDEQITRLLAGDVSHSPGIQPLELARREAGPEGASERAEARDHLRRHFARTPIQLHRTRPSSGKNEGRYYRSSLTLEDADRTFASIISSTELFPAAFILGMFSEFMCWRAGVAACSVNVSLDNRHNTELRQTRCATAQRSPVVVPAGNGGMLAAATRTQEALSRGHPVYGRYDPFDLIEEKSEAQQRRGACLGTDLAFNFIPPPRGWTALITADERPPAAAASGGIGGDVSWRTTEEVFYEYGASLSVRWSDPQTARLSVHGDSAVMTPEQCAAMLRGMKLGLEMAAAGQDCSADRIAGKVGLRPLSRTADEKRFKGGWVDLKAIEHRLRRVAGVREVALIPELDATAEVTRLTARVTMAPGAATGAVDLREELRTAIGAAEILAVPDRYEIRDAVVPEEDAGRPTDRGGEVT